MHLTLDFGLRSCKVTELVFLLFCGRRNSGGLTVGLELGSEAGALVGPAEFVRDLVVEISSNGDSVVVELTTGRAVGSNCLGDWNVSLELLITLLARPLGTNDVAFDRVVMARLG